MARKSKPPFTIEEAVKVLRRETPKFKIPIVSHFAKSPFKVLISTLLSLRTKDQTTEGAARRLFARAATPAEVLSLPLPEIEKLIFPAGFYRVKARTLHHVCRMLLERHGGEVPHTMDELLAIKGVGRKTANLVLTVGFNLPGICVDTHVHRISNRWGYVKTPTPEKTEMALRKKLPPKFWIEYNDLLVTWGQNVCLPVSPRCSECPLEAACPKIGVGKHR